MIAATWASVLSDKLAFDVCHLYMMFDGSGNILYVGTSVDAIERLKNHIGASDKWTEVCISRVGAWILENMPESLTWPVVILNWKDIVFASHSILHKPDARRFDTPSKRSAYAELLEREISRTMNPPYNWENRKSLAAYLSKRNGVVSP